MRSEVKLYPESKKEQLLSLFTKFFKDHILTQSMLQRDRNAYEKNNDLWQRFVKLMNSENSQKGEGDYPFKEIVKQIQEFTFNTLPHNKYNESYLKEIDSVYNSFLQDQDGIKQNNQNKANIYTGMKGKAQKRQLSIPVRPKEADGDSIIQEENLAFEYNYKRGISTGPHNKKKHSSILTSSETQQIKDINDKQGSGLDKKSNQKEIKLLSLPYTESSSNKLESLLNFNSSIEFNQQSQNSFSNISSSIAVNEIQEITEFFKLHNISKYEECLKNLLLELSAMESRQAYVYKEKVNKGEELDITSSFLNTISISFYQQLIQNGTNEEWQNLLELFSNQNKSQDTYQVDEYSQNTQVKMNPHQIEQFQNILQDTYKSIISSNNTSESIFQEFHHRLQKDKSVLAALQNSIKEQIVAACHLDESQSFRQDIYSNWFTKNGQTNLYEIDNQKLKLMSFSLKKRIAILKINELTSNYNQIEYQVSFDATQSFENHKYNTIPTIYFLWFNSQQTNDFYIIMNESQKQFYQSNRGLSRKDQKLIHYPFIQIKEISLQKVSSNLKPKSICSSQQPLNNFSQPSFTQIHDESNDNLQFAISSTFPQQEMMMLNSQKPSGISDHSRNCSNEKSYSLPNLSIQFKANDHSFSSEAISKLKEKSKKLKLIMLENNSLLEKMMQQQSRGNITPIKKQNNQNAIVVPTSTFNLEQISNFKKQDILQIKSNYQSPSRYQQDQIHILQQPTSANSQIQILGNKEVLSRGRNIQQPQIQLLNQVGTRCASQNNYQQQNDYPTKIVAQSPNRNLQKPIINVNIPQLLQQQSRLRVQSGHVNSVTKPTEEIENPGIKLLSSQPQSSKSNCKLLNQGGLGSITQFNHYGEITKEESPQRQQNLQFNQSNNYQQKLQQKAKLPPNQLYLNDSNSSERNILSILGFANTSSTNSYTNISNFNTSFATNTPNNFPQNIYPQQQAMFSSKNNFYHPHNNISNTSLTEQGIKMIKSQSTTNSSIKKLAVKNMPTLIDYQQNIESMIQNKSSTSFSVNNFMNNQKGISLKQSIVNN